jgi:hypothetical protein
MKFLRGLYTPFVDGASIPPVPLSIFQEVSSATVP